MSTFELLLMAVVVLCLLGGFWFGYVTGRQRGHMDTLIDIIKQDELSIRR